MRFFSKQEKQNTLIWFYWYSAQPHSSQVKTVQWYTENPTVRRQRGCDDDIQTNTERRQSLSFPPVGRRSFLSLCSLPLLSPFIFTRWWSWNRVEAPGATEGTALWTSQVCPAGSAVQCIIEMFREGGNESRALVSGVGWAQELRSTSTLLTDLRPPCRVWVINWLVFSLAGYRGVSSSADSAVCGAGDRRRLWFKNLFHRIITASRHL